MPPMSSPLIVISRKSLAATDTQGFVPEAEFHPKVIREILGERPATGLAS